MKFHKEKCPICKQTKYLYLRSNQRSDASFAHFIHCEWCKEWIGKIDFDDNIIFYNNFNKIRKDKLEKIKKANQ